MYHRLIMINIFHGGECSWVKDVRRKLLETLRIGLDGGSGARCSMTKVAIRRCHLTVQIDGPSRNIDRVIMQTMSVVPSSMTERE